MAFLPIYILILGFTIVVDYFAGIYIGKNTGARRKLFLTCSVIANVGVLAFFKYYNFINENISVSLNAIGYKNTFPYLSILLPIGLSFHTFQAMSYTIEVYRGNQKPERHFGIYALYVMFYPQLVAGPIERPQNMLHQFYEKHKFDYNRVTSGLKIMLWGFFKKIVIADRLALYVNAVFNNAHEHSGLTLLVACIFFSFQIYCDFSGYSEIAIGSAKVMGFNLMQNFRRPYFARNIQEFWQRWHISLSTWFRDYLYIPLGGSRVKKSKRFSNVMIVFIFSGLWHGANWTYIVWGFLHGIYQITGIIFKATEKINSLFRKFSVFINILITFCLVTLTWIFFRASSVSEAFYICKSIFTLKKGKFFLGDPQNTFVYYIFGILFLLTVEANQEYFNSKFTLLYNKNIFMRYAGLFLLILIIMLIGVFNGGQFIYFQF